MPRLIDIQGHRGARALFPENTLEGFLAAAALGVKAFELDVAMTADGVVVVSHDPALNPDITRDASGVWLSRKGPTIHTLTHAALRDYDVGRIRPGSRTAFLFPDQTPLDGSRIPTLAGVLAALPDACFTIEVKTNPEHPGWTATPRVLTDATLSVIDAAKAAPRIILESFDWRVQRHVRRSRPDIKLAWLTSATAIRDAALWWDSATPTQSYQSALDLTGMRAGLAGGGARNQDSDTGRRKRRLVSVPASVAAEGGPIWAPDHTSLTEPQIQEAHALGLLVLPWTVNQPADMGRLIAWGVDGLISDRPDLALKLV